MLVRMVRIAQEANLGSVELCATPSPDDPHWSAVLASGALKGALSWSAQTEGDLGQRMAHAIQRGLANNEQVICIGTDCLELDVTQLRAAASALHTHRVAIIPALDGGYVLLGLREYDASLFEEIAWSTDAVYGETLRRVAALGWSIAQFPPLRDIDQPDDLAFLPIEFKLK